MDYFLETGGAPEVAEEDAAALWRNAGAVDSPGSAADRAALAANFQPLIAAEAEALALRMAGRLPAGVSERGLAAWGNLGLLRAFCCWRPESAAGFYAFCRRRVCETMLDGLRAFGTPEAGAGIADPDEVARLWGELGREFAAPEFCVIRMKTRSGASGRFKLGAG